MYHGCARGVSRSSCSLQPSLLCDSSSRSCNRVICSSCLPRESPKGCVYSKNSTSSTTGLGPSVLLASVPVPLIPLGKSIALYKRWKPRYEVRTAVCYKLAVCRRQCAHCCIQRYRNVYKQSPFSAVLWFLPFGFEAQTEFSFFFDSNKFTRTGHTWYLVYIIRSNPHRLF